MASSTDTVAQARCRFGLDAVEIRWESELHSYSNRYPNPRSVRMCCGLPGSLSIFLRSAHT
jgi:hypothetical protein